MRLGCCDVLRCLLKAKQNTFHKKWFSFFYISHSDKISIGYFQYHSKLNDFRFWFAVTIGERPVMNRRNGYLLDMKRRL